jgi:hypothetical protein
MLVEEPIGMANCAELDDISGSSSFFRRQNKSGGWTYLFAEGNHRIDTPNSLCHGYQTN